MSGTPVTITGVAAGCDSPQYEFWIRPAWQTDWQLAQPYGADTTYSWDSLGEPAGVVYFAVWARDSTSGAAYDTSTFIWYSVTTKPRRVAGWPGKTD